MTTIRPATARHWILRNVDNGIDSLELEEAPLPNLGQFDVLVHIHAVSLNFRDVALATGRYPRGHQAGCIQGSDGAGEVVEVGSSVNELKVGDRVATTFFRDHLSGRFTLAKANSDLGGHIDGAFRDYGVFPVHGLVRVPDSMSYREAATLPCAALTAWSCMFSDSDEHIKPGDTVLTQGTGGVSLFALQFAVAAGANVIATTSSDDKAEMLKNMGAKSVINYREVENWGAKARELSPGQLGADIIVDIGGASTGSQCLQAVKPGNGQICLVGHRTGGAAEGLPTIWDVRQAAAKARSIFVGTRQQFEDMIKAIAAWRIKPVIDQKHFKFEDLKLAYRYLDESRHVGKIVIDVC